MTNYRDDLLQQNLTYQQELANLNARVNDSEMLKIDFEIFI